MEGKRDKKELIHSIHEEARKESTSASSGDPLSGGATTDEQGYFPIDKSVAFTKEDAENQDFDHPARRERRVSRLKARQKTGPGKLTAEQMKELQDLDKDSSDSGSAKDELLPDASGAVKA